MPEFGILRGFSEKTFGDKIVPGQLPRQVGLTGSVLYGFLPFIFTVKTDTVYGGSTNANQFRLPIFNWNGVLNFSVNWGDGTYDTITDANDSKATHTYTNPGTYNISIIGQISNWGYNNPDRLKITNIVQWGALTINIWNGFSGCSNMTCTATDAPTITSPSLEGMFGGCSKFNGAIGNWIMDSVTNIGGMFSGCTVFNQPLGSWNTANITNMSSVFAGCNAFNQNIAAWNVEKVTTMGNMFQGSGFNNGGSPDINNWKTLSLVNMDWIFAQSQFNQPIGSWYTSKVTSMFTVFYFNSVFNQNIGAWDISNVTNISYIFFNATAFNNGESPDINNWNPAKITDWSVQTFVGAIKFNQPIGGWNMSAATNLSGMFAGCTDFNNGGSSNINNWNVSNVTNMAGMFSACTNFNQPIGNWNVSKVTNMSNMFYFAKAFNQNVGLWGSKTGNVTTMNQMFHEAHAFNNGGSPDINNWDTSKVIDMYALFLWGKSFNQPLGNWNVSNVTNMQYMFYACGGLPFEQDISAWNISNVTNFFGFMDCRVGSATATTNLNLLYNAWSTRPVKTYVNISFGGARFTAAGASGKAALIGSPNFWTISDGGIQ